ncbi:MAG TPA: DUF971 domain-containing protein [Verrucomicrobiae bacterium]|nr:DUF971 domain-containing protein [Verrucomicrobiae bacterium]
MPLPRDARKNPTDVKVYVSTGAGVEITWSDGHKSRYDFPYLRDHCPCATCNDERQAKAGDKSSDVLPMYKERVKARAAKAVGNYAIQIDFSDAHATGIFTFEHLRELCPCDDCAREFRGEAKTAPA